MPSVRYSFIAAVLAGVLALASASSTVLMAGGIAVVQVVFAMGVVRASGAPSARPAAWLALAGGLGTLIWVELNGTPELAPMAVVLGPTVLIAFIVQLVRRDGRSGLNTALAMVITACVLTTLPVAWLALRLTPDGTQIVGLALLGVAAAALAEVLPMSRAIRRVLGVLLASIAAAVLVVVVSPVGDAVPAVSAVVISAFAGVMAAVTFAIADRLAGEVSSGEVPALVSVPEEVTVPDLGSARSGEPSAPDAGAPERTADSRAAAALSLSVPLRVSAPFVAAAPTAYVLGRLLVG